MIHRNFHWGFPLSLSWRQPEKRLCGSGPLAWHDPNNKLHLDVDKVRDIRLIKQTTLIFIKYKLQTTLSSSYLASLAWVSLKSLFSRPRHVVGSSRSETEREGKAPQLCKRVRILNRWEPKQIYSARKFSFSLRVSENKFNPKRPPIPQPPHSTKTEKTFPSELSVQKKLSS